MKLPATLVLAAILALAGCGTPGAPRPPSLDLPRPVNDLAAARVGDKVTLTWTAPRETTDRTGIRHPGTVRICRGVDQVAMVTCTQVGEVPPVAQPGTRKQPVTQTYTDVLPPMLITRAPNAFATYAVEALNDRGKSAGLSNQIEVPLAPALPPAEDLAAQVGPEAVKLTWTERPPYISRGAMSFSYHVFRTTEGAAPVDLGAGTASPFVFASRGYEFLDRTFEWEKKYTYWIVGFTTVATHGTMVEVQGNPSPQIQVFTRDVFPPATPVGLQAVASGVGQPPFIDLTWAPNTESDLAGYNVYRHEAGESPVKINAELVKAPAYRDTTVQRGHKYFYAVTAVDLRGNESARSEEASESVP